MERSRPRLVRVPAPGIAVPGDVPDQPGGGREAQGRLVGGGGRGDASVRGAAPIRSDGSRAGLLRDRRDPSTHRQHPWGGGILRARSRDRSRPTARARPPPLRPREERSRGGGAPRRGGGRAGEPLAAGPAPGGTGRHRARDVGPRHRQRGDRTTGCARFRRGHTHPRRERDHGAGSAPARSAGPDSGARNPSAGVLDLAGSPPPLRERPELGCSTDSPFERPGTRTARDPSSTPPCPRSNDSARARMPVLGGPSRRQGALRVGSPTGRPRSCASWQRARRTGTSPPCS